MDLVIFEENKPFVLTGLENGDFDYIESASEVFEADFFRFIKAKGIIDELSRNYPNPRKKEDVPLWLYVASNLSMRLHGSNAFNAFPMVVRCGGMLNAFGPEMGRKVIHPDTGDLTVVCEGFNEKNHYDRESPCDQDFLRKIAKDTEADALMNWLSGDVVSIFQDIDAFDKEGIFIGDASYLFVPDNPNYEGSAKLLFDENNHPISQKKYKKLTDKQKIRCQWKRCYKMVTLLHTNRALEFFLVVAVQVISGRGHESPILYELVKKFVDTSGKGVMKRLILDRGFLDGESISTCKDVHGIDILIPIRRNMDIYKDAAALFRLPEVQWIECKKRFLQSARSDRPKPDFISKREKKRRETLKGVNQKKPMPKPEDIIIKKEAAVIGEFRTWSSCTVPLNIVANREIYADGHENIWLLADTRECHDPSQTREEYHLRTAIEERYRQFKCFCDLTKFTSRSFSMVVNQVVFIFLAYNLLQIYLLHQQRKELNNRTMPGIRQQLMPSTNHLIVYWQNYYCLFEPFEFVEIIATLNEEARKKIAEKCRRIRHELKDAIKNPRAP